MSSTIDAKSLDVLDGGIRSLICESHNLEELTLRLVKNLTSLPEEIGDLVSLKKLTILGQTVCGRYSGIRSLPSSIGRLHNLEEIGIRKTYSLLSLPKEIGDLVSLKKLKLDESAIKSLPPSIGRLHNLEELGIRKTHSLLSLPKEIGDLVSLKKLNLYESAIKSLPPSIGRLHNLEELNLRNTRHLLSLPEEIGDLVSLKKLKLNSSVIKSLPPSIGRLHNLKELNLRNTRHLLSLPEEIGDLVSLKKLDLDYSGITSLPPSIGRLHNLEELDLRSVKNLTSLPEEIGNFTKLKMLALGDSGISLLSSMPDSMGRMKSLTHICIERFFTHNTKCDDLGKNQCEFLLMLARRLRLLGSIVWTVRFDELDAAGDGSFTAKDYAKEGSFTSPYAKELWYILACNRARSRIGFETIHEAPTLTTPMTPKLWPLLLNCAPRAFRLYSFDSNEVFYELYPDYPDLYDCGITKPDAIYRLLVLGRESFMGVLLNRKAEDAPTRMRETLIISSPARKKIRRS